ncbi:MAG: hypothetical protein ABSG91_24420, partial [Syntrophobacteraceae bacterium]
MRIRLIGRCAACPASRLTFERKRKTCLMRCVGVKYCGGCNPQIERSRFVDELKKKLARDLRLAICRST